MHINWKFKLSNEEYQKIGPRKLCLTLMKELGLNEDEIEFQSEIVSASPNIGLWRGFVTPLSITIYDAMIWYDSEKGLLNLKIRLYNLYIFMLLGAGYGAIVNGLVGFFVGASLVGVFLLASLALDLFLRNTTCKDAIDSLADRNKILK